ncbi:CRISPR-associated endonuclease Cas3'' [Armatimonas sp.]|uniref:CRISPR-associated endonuclease Cas3'' n=1 Tax=Armatimonas sp. TaxID=1872638 RepID=UPI0037526156
MEDEPLAHSPKKDVPAQTYNVHITNVKRLATCSAKRAATFYDGKRERFIRDVESAALFHDLGKLDEHNQAVLRGVNKGRLRIPHEDAGVAYLWSLGLKEAAHLVSAHHAGLADWEVEGNESQCLRNRKLNDDASAWYVETDTHLSEYLRSHRDDAHCLTLDPVEKNGGLYGKAGFLRRIALSCLVDADHGDTARNYGGEVETKPIEPRWEERLNRLNQHVEKLAEEAKKKAVSDDEQKRISLREDVYKTCRDAAIDGPIRSCDAVVGSGKTTALMAHLLHVAKEKGLRHIIVVLPYTNIITQSVEVYRKALTLEGENPEEVVAEHHHKADFGSRDARQLATLWQAPIIVTTAVQFFETLASHHPSRLRKLHKLPGSAVFIDESHAAIPTALWKQTWRWLETWTQKWSGYCVLASGSLARFWEIPDIVPATPTIADLIGKDLGKRLREAEQRRVKYVRIADALTVPQLMQKVKDAPGPRLVIVNTVQSAAVFADTMRKAGHDVLHLSTALAPAHRDVIVKRIKERLKHDNSDWTLVATSCVEAGMNFSFRTGFRETSTAASLIQVSGRTSREAEFADPVVYDFRLIGDLITKNPAFDNSSQVLTHLFSDDSPNRLPPSELVLEAMRQELNAGDLKKAEKVVQAEEAMNYPAVSKEYRVIDAPTLTVVIDKKIIAELLSDPWAKISSRDLQRLSVQLWPYKIEKGDLPIKLLKGDKNDYDALYYWDGKYDPDFLGYMAGALPLLKDLLTLNRDGCLLG